MHHNLEVPLERRRSEHEHIPATRSQAPAGPMVERERRAHLQRSHLRRRELVLREEVRDQAAALLARGQLGRQPVGLGQHGAPRALRGRQRGVDARAAACQRVQVCLGRVQRLRQIRRTVCMDSFACHQCWQLPAKKAGSARGACVGC